MRKLDLGWRGWGLALVTSMAWISPLFAQPAEIGQWTGVANWPYEAIHTFMLPTGKVMFWQTWRESIGLWDPVTNQFSTPTFPLPAQSPSVSAFNPFCAGHAWLADGRLMVVGGNVGDNQGLNRANIYDPFTNTWANNVPNMPSIPAGAPYGVGRSGRWYPSATTLGNGDILAMSGDMFGVPPAGESDTNPLPQVYEVATNTWRNLTTAYKQLPLYPRTFLAPDGRVVSLSGFGQETEFLDTSGTGEWTHVTNTLWPGERWDYAPAVMYDTGKVVFIGGDKAPSPTSTAEMIDLNAENPTWNYTAGEMAQPRRQHNATILADGTVLVTGGTSVGSDQNEGYNDPTGKIAAVEIWDPATEMFTQVAPASSVYRGYHATALLLPDGRVLFAGGNHSLPNYVEQKSAEIYSPAYLFAEDGSPAVRPTVTNAPDVVELGDTIFVETPDAQSITKALWVVPGAVTHAQNWTQRANVFDLEGGDLLIEENGVSIQLPDNGNEAPPGYYMLFLVNEDGTPSMAHWIQATPYMPLPGDYNDDHVVNAADYTVWRDAMGTMAELPNDDTAGVTMEDYAVWKDHYGMTDLGGAGGISLAGVPEPASFALAILGCLAVAAINRSARRD